MIFFGTVVNVTDDLKLGRVKVKVYDLHDNIDIKDLPWSMVVMPANTPGVRGLGHNVNLQIGTLVVGIFLDPHQQEFLVQGTLPTKTDGIADNNARVRGEPNPHAGEPVATYQPISTYAPVYPYNNVMETESGHVKEYDDTPSAERITERHKSGTQYEVGPNGSKTEVITRDNYRLVVGHDTLEVYGNVRVIISGHADVAVAGNLTASVAGNIAAESKGNITLKTNDLTKKITLTGNVDITENLTVAKDVTVTGKTRTSTSQLIDGHQHTHSGINPSDPLT